MNAVHPAEAALTFAITTGMDGTFVISQRLARGYGKGIAFWQWMGIPVCNVVMAATLWVGMDWDPTWYVVSRRLIGAIWLGVVEHYDDRNQIQRSGSSIDA